MHRHDYIHGYSERESSRLCDQAGTLTELLHGDTRYPAGSHVLEAGCGVGAQTVILAGKSPGARFTSIDISPTSLAAAQSLIAREHIGNVTFRAADIVDLPFKAVTFDHVFVSFVLEHLENPVEALRYLKRVVKKGGTITVIEGDHGSVSFHPESRAARQIIQCLIHIQARLGGNSQIGRQLYPLLKDSGFVNPVVAPLQVYVDSANPELVEGFTRNTFIAMAEGVREQALAYQLIDEARWAEGIADLYATTSDHGVFCYTFFKGLATKA
jgi:ubiquinone/menaquinone biosynthesis C-methylase UbiE